MVQSYGKFCEDLVVNLVSICLRGSSLECISMSIFETRLSEMEVVRIGYLLGLVGEVATYTNKKA